MINYQLVAFALQIPTYNSIEAESIGVLWAEHFLGGWNINRPPSGGSRFILARKTPRHPQNRTDYWLSHQYVSILRTGKSASWDKKCDVRIDRRLDSRQAWTVFQMFRCSISWALAPWCWPPRWASARSQCSARWHICQTSPARAVAQPGSNLANQSKTIARGTTDPGYIESITWAISPAKKNATCIGYKFGQHVVPLVLFPLNTR